ncbi:hypothetical protein QFW77_09000 [Luteimonas sp. RD2P54]|uniref:Transmembrane protein n=1 Tax=Luteimonas endophytica TaxID=3042023 RepID=A0ABT6J8H5_9GAMM|nr:hypothetical protein [Luteimonas endophytica]MDH5823124.1 hypothetical protein [Luteimonas endophytica]
MTGAPFDLQAIALLLRQGRRLHGASLGLAGLAGLWLILGTMAPVSPGAPVLALLIASLLAAVAQLYCAIRTDFDAALFHAIAALPQADAMRTLDDSLQTLGLQPAGHGGRSWDARWRGACGWLRRQGVLAGAQLLLMAGAWLAAHFS